MKNIAIGILLIFILFLAGCKETQYINQTILSTQTVVSNQTITITADRTTTITETTTVTQIAQTSTFETFTIPITTASYTIPIPEFTTTMPAINYLLLGVAYEAPDNMYVTILDIIRTNQGGIPQVQVTYKLENRTSGANIKIIDEGSFQCYYSDGGSVPQYGFFNKVYPGESLTRSYTFDEEIGRRLSILEYQHEFGANFFSDTPTYSTLKWLIP